MPSSDDDDDDEDGSVYESKPRWFDWVHQNAQPKYRNYKREPEVPTRWQKPGPMSKRDWVHFYQWCEINAVPIAFESSSFTHATADERTGGGMSKAQKKIEAQKLREKIQRLSQPKRKREKYIPSKPTEYPYNPKIHRHKPALRERRRPFKKPIVPCCFQHDELEAKFWFTMRFPVSRSARHYKISPSIRELAKPRVLPPKPHCLAGVPPNMLNDCDCIAPRKRFTARQWREHKRRLEFLARPTERTMAEIPCICNRCRY